MESNKSSSSSKLRDRLARIFRPASLLRSSCNPSTSSAAAASSANTSSRALLADVGAPVPVSVPDGRHRRRLTRTVDSDRSDLGRSLSFPIPDGHRRRCAAPLPRLSADCGGCRPHRDALAPPIVVKSTKGSNASTCKKSAKMERRVRENGGFYETGGKAEGRTCPPVSPSSSPSKASQNYYYRCFNEAKLEENQMNATRLITTKKKKKEVKENKNKKLLTNSYGFTSSSSIESDDAGDGFFSSDEGVGKREEETETFFSSRSFSSDSSEFYRRPLHRSNYSSKNAKEKSTATSARRPPRRRRRVASSCNGCNVKEGFRPLVSAVPKEIRKGFAVVKRSSDPYGDFRTSMLEMIVERQIFGADDLERLLQSYLSLNSPRHHPVILQAFSDIWAALFGN